MLSGDARFHIYGSKAVISLTAQVWRDSSFPFKNDEKVECKILDGDTVMIKKKGGGKQRRLDHNG